VFARVRIVGISSNNTIYVIAFMICWGETPRTLSKFFEIIRTNRPDFYNNWLDNKATTLIGDRGPGCCLKGVVFKAFPENGPHMLRSCVVHVIRGAKRHFGVSFVNGLGLVQTLGNCVDLIGVQNTLSEIKATSEPLHAYIMKTDIEYWVPAYVKEDKAHFFKVTSNMSEQEFARFNRIQIRSQDPVGMCQQIVLLVERCLKDFLNTCQAQEAGKKLLTPFASQLHEDKKKLSQFFQVKSIDSSTHISLLVNHAWLREMLTIVVVFVDNYRKACNVVRRGQGATHQIGAHASFDSCSCMFQRGMIIPCEHMEALYTKSFKITTPNAFKKNVDDAYADWIEEQVAKFFQIKYIVPKIAGINVLGPLGPFERDRTLKIKGLTQATQPNHSDAARFKGREEGNYGGNKRPRPLQLSSFANSILELIRRLDVRLSIYGMCCPS
jgi:hypothetical protein